MLALQIIGIVHCAIIVDLFFSSLLENLQDSSLVLRFSSRETVTRVYRGGRSPSTFSPEEIGVGGGLSICASLSALELSLISPFALLSLAAPDLCGRYEGGDAEIAVSC